MKSGKLDWKTMEACDAMATTGALVRCTLHSGAVLIGLVVDWYILQPMLPLAEIKLVIPVRCVKRADVVTVQREDAARGLATHRRAP